MSRVLNVLLGHQPARQLQPFLDLWRQASAPEALLLAFGGPAERIEELDHPAVIHIDDARLRTRDHQRDQQSYTAIFRQTVAWLKANGRRGDFDCIHLVEYDQLPLVADLNARQAALLEEERADVLAFHLHRVDGTNSAHYLYHTREPRFHACFADLSRRSDRETVLSMFGTGSFWRREAFEAVAAIEEPFPVYLELWLPTLAHHLGYRVRPFSAHVAPGCIRAEGDLLGGIAAARAAGAWTIHPVKKFSPGALDIAQARRG